MLAQHPPEAILQRPQGQLPTAEQLVIMDLDAAMFVFNDYLRQAFETVEMYLLRYEYATGDFDGNVAIDFLGNFICPTKQ